MDSQNLAVVVGPNILRDKVHEGSAELKDMGDINTAIVSAARVLIEHQQDLWVIPSELLEDIKGARH